MIELKSFSVLLLVFVAGLSAGCSTFKSWLSQNQQRRTFQVRNVWTTQTTQAENLGFRKINRFTPLFYRSKARGEMLIQANSMDGVNAYDKKTGRRLWRLDVLNGVESSATIKGSYLFFGASDGQFYCVDADNGQVVWTFPTRTENLSEPIVEDGLVFFLTGANSLYALEADTGKQAWLYARPETANISIRGGSKPAYRAGTLYVGFSDGAVVSLLAKSGQVKWEKQLNRNKKFRDMDTNPLVDGDVVYVLGFDDATYALRAATGDLVWRFEKGGYGGFLMVGDRLYFGSTTDELIALDKTTGRLVWSHPVKNGIATQPSMLKGVIVYGESLGSLRFLEANSGRELGHFEPGRGLLSPPAVDGVNNTVYFISNEANLYAIEAKWAPAPALPHLR